jgi:Ran GTPase-activating protein (RanGAP) involved in mRNA processing and transport
MVVSQQRFIFGSSKKEQADVEDKESKDEAKENEKEKEEEQTEGDEKKV